MSMTRGPYRTQKRDAHRPEVQRRHSAGTSQAQIAREMGLSRTTVQRWLNPKFARRVHKLNAGYKRTWEDAKWADGPALYAWVTEHVEDRRISACGVRDQVSAWKDRGKVSFWVVDSVFTRLALHVAQLPNEVWIG